jgi:hypothetical protein
MVSLAVSFNVQEAIDEAKILYNEFKATGKKYGFINNFSHFYKFFRPTADVAGTVYNLGVSEGDYDDWEFMFMKYLQEIDADEKVI